jgi:hypothetical protein
LFLQRQIFKFESVASLKSAACSAGNGHTHSRRGGFRLLHSWTVHLPTSSSTPTDGDCYWQQRLRYQDNFPSNIIIFLFWLLLILVGWMAFGIPKDPGKHPTVTFGTVLDLSVFFFFHKKDKGV